MLTPDSSSPPSGDKVPLLFRAIKAARGLGANAALYAAVLGSIAIAGTSPEATIAFVSSMGIDTMRSILERIAAGKASEAEICDELHRAIAESNIAVRLQERDVQEMVGRLFHELDILQYAITSRCLPYLPTDFRRHSHSYGYGACTHLTASLFGKPSGLKCRLDD